MSQNVNTIEQGFPLFNKPEYQDAFARKRVFEEAHSLEKIEEVFQWTTTEEYKELNFKRQLLGVNPNKVCQPAGAVLCALGFHKTLPYVHGSQGCVAYFRTYFNRHFREPVAAVSDSMTEDAAVFGGQKNIFEGLENAKKDGRVPMDFPTPFASTPSFVGSHTTGWDNMLEGILRYFTLNHMEGKTPGSNGKLNLVLGFDGYLGNLRVIKRMLKEMDVAYTFLSDPEEILDTPADGEFRMYAGGTTQDEIKDAPNAIDTLLLQPSHLTKTRKYIQETWNHAVPTLEIPMGLAWTDAFLMKVSELTGKPIPESLEKERGRLIDMMADSHQWLHGKKYSVFGDPDFVTGMCQVLMELGAEPLHVLCQNGSKKWAKDIAKLLKSSPYGQEAEVYMGKDLWHLRSLVFSKKPDFLIGNSYGKFIQRDTLHKGKEHEVPLVRLGFPLFDRHHLHRDTTLGYEGTMYILKTLVNAVMERMDQDTMIMGETDYAFDLVR